MNPKAKAIPPRVGTLTTRPTVLRGVESSTAQRTAPAELRNGARRALPMADGPRSIDPALHSPGHDSPAAGAGPVRASERTAKTTASVGCLTFDRVRRTPRRCQGRRVRSANLGLWWQVGVGRMRRRG